MTNDLKLFLGIIIGTLVLVFGAVFLISRNNSQTSPSSNNTLIVPTEYLVRSDSWSIGTESAKVTLVEFSDLQCPACRLAETYVLETLEKNKDKSFRFVYRHYPLVRAHYFAIDAAIAAEAAGRQGKFWEYIAKLFTNQPEDNTKDNFKRENLIKYATDLGLNKDQFTKDLDDPALRQRVLNDQADGDRANVSGTPTFFINGQKYEGRFPDLPTAVSEALSR